MLLHQTLYQQLMLPFRHTDRICSESLKKWKMAADTSFMAGCVQLLSGTVDRVRGQEWTPERGFFQLPDAC